MIKSVPCIGAERSRSGLYLTLNKQAEITQRH